MLKLFQRHFISICRLFWTCNNTKFYWWLSLPALEFTLSFVAIFVSKSWILFVRICSLFKILSMKDGDVSSISLSLVRFRARGNGLLPCSPTPWYLDFRLTSLIRSLTLQDFFTTLASFKRFQFAQNSKLLYCPSLISEN